MHTRIKSVLVLFGLLFSFVAHAGSVRVKNLGAFHGVRSNPISGVGVVVGLNRTGDSKRNEASVRSLANRLRGMGINLDTDDISARNVALVMVAGRISAHHRTGSVIDVSVASAGDATSLEGGILLPTLLVGLDRQVYAIAQGAMIVGGYLIGSEGNTSRKNTPTSGRVVGGGIIEREVASKLDYNKLEGVDFVLRYPDFTTAVRIAEGINEAFGQAIAQAMDSATVSMDIPTGLQGRFADFALRVEGAEVEVAAPARVVINERTGTVVMGADVRISAVAVAHGGLTIEVQQRVGVSQPAPLSGGQTAVVSETRVKAVEEEGRLQLLEGATIGDMVTALNDMGVKPRDLIVILQAIAAAGGLHAEVVTL